jgi:hypothetical protein
VPNAAPDAAHPGIESWDRLELSVRRLMEEHDAWQRRALAAETRVRELEAALADVSAGRLDPLTATNRADSLERENRQLARRMNNARIAVQRLLDRIQFAEEDR